MDDLDECNKRESEEWSTSRCIDRSIENIYAISTSHYIIVILLVHKFLQYILEHKLIQIFLMITQRT